MNETRRERKGSAGRMLLGIYLLGLGVILIADKMGYDVPGEVWNYWPFLLIGLGTVKLFWPGDRDEREGGFWILVAGVYCLISVWELFGLHWGSAWPIFLLAGGLTMVLEGFGGRRRDGKVSDAS